MISSGHLAENKDGTIWCGTQSAVIYLIKPVFDANGNPDLSKFTFKKFDGKEGFIKALGGVWHVKNENYFPGDSFIYRFDEKIKRFLPDTTFGVFKQTVVVVLISSIWWKTHQEGCGSVLARKLLWQNNNQMVSKV